MRTAYYLRAIISTTLLMAPLVSAHAAGGTLYLTPQNGVYQVGQSFEVQVLADTGGQAISAAEAELAYNPSDFSIEKISIDNSILTSWSTTPAYDSATGIIKFSGWVKNNYMGSRGLLVSITMHPLRVVQGTLVFNSGSMLAADGHGSNIINTMTSGGYSVAPKQVAAEVPVVATSTTNDASSSVQTPAQASAVAPAVPPQQPLPATTGTSQAASIIESGIELAPFAGIFFAILVFVAFCIAYLLHRKGRE